EELVTLVAVLGRERDPDAAADRDGLAVDLEGSADCFDEPRSEHRAGTFRAAAARPHDQSKLIAAEPCRDVDFADFALDAPGHLAEQDVSRLMAVSVVDAFEAIEVEQEHRELRLLLRQQVQAIIDALAEQVAIGEIGERVVMRELSDLCLRALAL